MKSKKEILDAVFKWYEGGVKSQSLLIAADKALGYGDLTKQEAVYIDGLIFDWLKQQPLWRFNDIASRNKMYSELREQLS